MGNGPHEIFDCTSANPDLGDIDIANPLELTRYRQKKMAATNAVFGIGKYLEDRKTYDHSDLFAGPVRRTVHLGIDLAFSAGVEVLCPFDATMHSFKDNVGNGNYGPTIILEHRLEGITFYTLYGHLSRQSLRNISVGQNLAKGQPFGQVGDYPENGNWPPHLHFQIITDMQGNDGDYPGVCAITVVEKYAVLCPDPNLILQISGI